MSNFSDKTGLANPAIQARLDVMRDTGSELFHAASKMIAAATDHVDIGRMIAFLDALSHAEHDLLLGRMINEVHAKKRRVEQVIGARVSEFPPEKPRSDVLQPADSTEK